jgi:hypothetical protein
MVLPAITRTPVREPDPVLGAAVKETEPLPVPPEPTLSQLILLYVLQEQAELMLTATEPVPPAAAMEK